MPSFVTKILNAIGLQRRDAGTVSTAPDSPRTGLSLSDLLGLRDPALCVATVYRCVKLISESVAQLPLYYQQRDPRTGIYTPMNASALDLLLRTQPSSRYNAFDFFTRLVEDYLLEGNAYILPRYGASMDVEELVLLTRGSVTVDKDTMLYAVNDDVNHISGTYEASQIIHIRNLGVAPHKGDSVLTHARKVILTAKTGEDETLDRFQSGGQVRGIVSNARGSVRGWGEYQDKQLRKLAKDTDNSLRGGDRIIAMLGQADFKQIQMSSADMQFLQMRQLCLRDICRFFGVHPSYVFDETSSNYKSAEMANAAFLSNTLNPILCKIETELLCKLVHSSVRADRRFRFDRTALYACDLESKADYYGKMVGVGAMTVNEVRRLENMPPVPDGDRPMISANLRPLNDNSANQ